MNYMKTKLLQLLILTLSLPVFLFAQKSEQKEMPDTVNYKIFKLGEITITASKEQDINDRVNSEDIANQNKMEVSRALNMLPGITLTGFGQRNESTITVRGFDLRQVPVYMDGIPVYVPYDGYVDLGRFTTFDLSVIDVSKGFSSILYGPNSLGGSINLISRKPQNKIELDGAIGTLNDNGYRANMNAGSNLGKFYVQGGLSYLHRDAYYLSSHFDSTKNENGKQRDNSYRTDQKLNIKMGWIPNSKHEYVLGYINQQGSKGNPIYCGKDTLNTLLKKPRYWQWPRWNKETYYFFSNTKLNDKNYIASRIYYDIFKNEISSFDDVSYSTQTKPYAFNSFYNDYTYGGSIEYGTQWIPKNNLKLALHYKEDVHRENNLGEPVRRFEDNTMMIGIEDVYQFNDKLMIIPGIGYSQRRNIKAEDYISSTKEILDYPKSGISQAFNDQLGLYYLIKDEQKVGATFSHKTRFATIKDRFSYRMGTAIPNPDLKPESADNFEINYTGTYLSKITFQSALFYSKITDAIMSISNVQPGKSQMQNAGSAEFFGLEAGMRYDVLKNLIISANYTYIERNNLTNINLHFTDVPNNKVYGYIQYKPIKQIQILASTEYNSFRYSSSYGNKADGFMLANAFIYGDLYKYLRLELGVNNIFDKNYSLVEGYPEEGRNYLVTLRFFYHK